MCSLSIFHERFRGPFQKRSRSSNMSISFLCYVYSLPRTWQEVVPGSIGRSPDRFFDFPVMKFFDICPELFPHSGIKKSRPRQTLQRIPLSKRKKMKQGRERKKKAQAISEYASTIQTRPDKGSNSSPKNNKSITIFDKKSRTKRKERASTRRNENKNCKRNCGER